MSDVALPKIKVTDALNLDRSTAGTSGVASPTTTADGAQFTRPRSATSSEGLLLESFAHFSLQCLLWIYTFSDDMAVASLSCARAKVISYRQSSDE